MTDESAFQEYKRVGQPPTPAAIQDLILELFAGQLVERRTIVDEVLATHIKRGGLPSRAKDFPRSVKKALTKLQEGGKAEHPSHGYWRIGAPAETAEPLQGAQESATCPAETAVCPPDEEAEQPIADTVLGEGSGVVYLYYLPAYRAAAERNGDVLWPCKIGKTDGDPLTRVLSQAATALPERPHIAVILRTDMPKTWETALHNALTLRGLRIKDSPGAEWFLSSPDELLDLIRALDPRLCR